MLASQKINTSENDTFISLWKNELSNRLDTFCRIAEEYNQALKKAEPYLGRHTSSLSGYSEMSNIVSEWLDDICDEANREANNISHVKITTQFLPSSLRDFDFPRSDSIYSPDPEIKKEIPFYEASDKLLKDWIIENFDFYSLKTSMDEAKSEIQSIGFRKCAGNLSSNFNMQERGYYEDNKLIVKKQKGRYLLEMRHYGNWVYQRVNDLQSLKDNAITFEREADIVGLSYCIQMLINEERALEQYRGYDIWVESRTKVAEDGTVSAQFFKEKIKFAFEPEIFEAFISFINEHKGNDVNLKEIVIG